MDRSIFEIIKKLTEICLKEGHAFDIDFDQEELYLRINFKKVEPEDGSS